MSASASPVSPAADEPTSRRSRRLASPLPLSRLLPRLRPFRWRLALAAICLLLAAGVGLAFPQVVRHLLDAAFQQHDRGLLDRIATALVGLFALQGVMNFVQLLAIHPRLTK
jgi:ABC-type multidrug transport system fused ATPase/permease subunit